MNLELWCTNFRLTWEKKDVKSWLYPNHGVVILNELQIVAHKRGHGLGSRFMNDLLRRSDKWKFNVELTPSVCYGASSLQRLIRFYKKFGFKKISRQRKRDMIRFHKGD